jgi:hypothetical protein
VVYTGTELSVLANNLEAGARHLFRVQATNRVLSLIPVQMCILLLPDESHFPQVGKSTFSGHSVMFTATTQKAGRAELPPESLKLRNGANNWIEFWDSSTSACFYFNKVCVTISWLQNT